MNAAVMSNLYLLEIGTEELPAGFLATAPAELEGKVRQALDELALPCLGISVFATPRRLALRIDGLPESQGDREQLLKGPPARVALDAEGKMTQAALGFAKKSGIDANLLKQEVIDGETYLVHRQMISGKPSAELLADILPDLVLGLSGSHFMRWANHEVKFSRPIRWLLSLWNSKHLPISIGPVSSSNVTFGHRVLSKVDGPITISGVEAYADTLQSQGSVLVDQSKRRETIWQMISETAKCINGTVIKNEELLDTVTMLVESPSIIVGRFKEQYLEVPSEVTTTVMAVHQKYFPVLDAKGNLMPCFLTVSNGKPESADTIRIGNEKVITPRFEDARFFFEEDKKTPLADRLEALKGVTFQKGMGSMNDKAQRLQSLSKAVAIQMDLSIEQIKHVERAALLAKADLVTSMVFEFTELQGVMGQKYAQLQGEPEAVSQAIFEHYLPRFNGDLVATSPIGLAVSLADKIDTLVCVFGQENAKLPTGSKDPMGLRRMALGVIETISQNQLKIDLPALFKAAYGQLGKLATATEQTMLDRLKDFMRQRLKVNWLEENIRHDVLDAVLEAGNDPFSDLQDARTRLGLLRELITNEQQLKALYEPANRISKILGDKYIASATVADIQPAKFVATAEQALFDLLPAVVDSSDYTALIQSLLKLTSPIEQFFDAVLINDPDQAVRQNRYNILSVIHSQYLRLANFSKLVVS